MSDDDMRRLIVRAAELEREKAEALARVQELEAAIRQREAQLGDDLRRGERRLQLRRVQRGRGVAGRPRHRAGAGGIMKRWRYIEPTSATDSTPVVVTMSEAEILAAHYAHWCDEMRRAGKADEISEQACVEDWVTVHWAERVLEEPMPMTRCSRCGKIARAVAATKCDDCDGVRLIERAT